MRGHLEVLRDIRLKVEETRYLARVFPERRDSLARGACELVRLAVQVLEDLESRQENWGRVARASLGGYVK